MGDFKQRIRDWKEYRRDHEIDILVSKTCMTTFRTRSIWWFLLQSQQERIASEEEEIRILEEMLEERRKEIENKKRSS